MKKSILLFLMSVLTLSVSAQMTKKPTFRPDWTFKAPAPENSTYIYVVEHGEGKTKREALNQAIGRVFQSTANRIGQFVSTDEINKAVQAGTDYNVIARNMNVPVNKVCEFATQDTIDYSWTMYILCQVAKAGNITPEFETSEECTKHSIYDSAIAKWNQQIKDEEKEAEEACKKEKKRVDGTALAASFFVPGAGQMYKGRAGVGTGILLGELALVGGGVTCYFLGKKQLDVMRGINVEYDAFHSAQNMYNTMRIASYSCYGAAAALYVFNLVNAYMIEPDRWTHRNYYCNATIIPVNEFSTPVYAMGASLQIKF